MARGNALVPKLIQAKGSNVKYLALLLVVVSFASLCVLQSFFVNQAAFVNGGVTPSHREVNVGCDAMPAYVQRYKEYWMKGGYLWRANRRPAAYFPHPDKVMAAPRKYGGQPGAINRYAWIVTKAQPGRLKILEYALQEGSPKNNYDMALRSDSFIKIGQEVYGRPEIKTKEGETVYGQGPAVLVVKDKSPNQLYPSFVPVLRLLKTVKMGSVSSNPNQVPLGGPVGVRKIFYPGNKKLRKPRQVFIPQSHGVAGRIKPNQGPKKIRPRFGDQMYEAKTIGGVDIPARKYNPWSPAKAGEEQ